MRDGRSHKCQRDVAEAVHNRQPENDPEFSENGIGENRAEDWQKIECRNKCVIPRFRLCRRHHAQVTHLVQKIFGHEDGQDGIHPVVREALGRFVTDDVGHARRHGVAHRADDLEALGIGQGARLTGRAAGQHRLHAPADEIGRERPGGGGVDASRIIQEGHQRHADSGEQVHQPLRPANSGQSLILAPMLT